MVRHERTVTRIGTTLLASMQPGDMLVRLHGDGSTERADAITIACDGGADMVGTMVGLDSQISTWVPHSAWVVMYRVV